MINRGHGSPSVRSWGVACPKNFIQKNFKKKTFAHTLLAQSDKTDNFTIPHIHTCNFFAYSITKPHPESQFACVADPHVSFLLKQNWVIIYSIIYKIIWTSLLLYIFGLVNFCREIDETFIKEMEKRSSTVVFAAHNSKYTLHMLYCIPFLSLFWVQIFP